MDGTLSTPPLNSNLSSRPRLTPGVPAGGIAALIVLVGAMGFALASGEGWEEPDFEVGIHAPVPPIPPVPPMPPRAPNAPEMQAEAEAIRAAVREAMADVEIEETKLEALRAAQQGLAEAQAEIAAARAELEAEGENAPAIARHALRAAEMGVAAASGAADGAMLRSNGAESSFTATYEAPRGVQLINLSGDITVERSSKADKVRVEVDGGGHNLRADVADGVLTVRAPDSTSNTSLHLVIPNESDLTVVGLTGDLSISGRSDGKLSLQIVRGDVSAERVGALTVDIAETGNVSVQRVDGPLHVSVAGSGELSVERADSAKLDINGHANISIGRVNDALIINVPGHAEMDIGRVNGAVKLDFAGAGQINIGEGEAESLLARVSGAGNFDFQGTAHNPLVVASGVGNVYIAKHEGRAQVTNTGTGTTYVGD